jgi:hypothetical protein
VPVKHFPLNGFTGITGKFFGNGMSWDLGND